LYTSSSHGVVVEASTAGQLQHSARYLCAESNGADSPHAVRCIGDSDHSDFGMSYQLSLCTTTLPPPDTVLWKHDVDGDLTAREMLSRCWLVVPPNQGPSICYSPALTWPISFSRSTTDSYPHGPALCHGQLGSIGRLVSKATYRISGNGWRIPEAKYQHELEMHLSNESNIRDSQPQESCHLELSTTPCCRNSMSTPGSRGSGGSRGCIPPLTRRWNLSTN
jgi:hypothetical protein